MRTILIEIGSGDYIMLLNIKGSKKSYTSDIIISGVSDNGVTTERLGAGERDLCQLSDFINKLKDTGSHD